MLPDVTALASCPNQKPTFVSLLKNPHRPSSIVHCLSSVIYHLSSIVHSPLHRAKTSLGTLRNSRHVLTRRCHLFFGWMSWPDVQATSAALSARLSCEKMVNSLSHLTELLHSAPAFPRIYLCRPLCCSDPPRTVATSSVSVVHSPYKTFVALSGQFNLPFLPQIITNIDQK